MKTLLSLIHNKIETIYDPNKKVRKLTLKKQKRMIDEYYVKVKETEKNEAI